MMRVLRLSWLAAAILGLSLFKDSRAASNFVVHSGGTTRSLAITTTTEPPSPTTTEDPPTSDDQNAPCTISASQLQQLEEQLYWTIWLYELNFNVTNHFQQHTQEPLTIGSAFIDTAQLASCSEVAAIEFLLAEGIYEKASAHFTALPDHADERVQSHFRSLRARVLPALLDLRLFYATLDTSALPKFIQRVTKLNKILQFAISNPKSLDPDALNITQPPSATGPSVSSKYAGNIANFEVTLNHVLNLPSVDDKLQGFVDLYAEMERGDHLDTPQLLQFAIYFKMYQPKPQSGTSDYDLSQGALLYSKLEPLITFLNFRHPGNCTLQNIAYGVYLNNNQASATTTSAISVGTDSKSTYGFERSLAVRSGPQRHAAPPAAPASGLVSAQEASTYMMISKNGADTTKTVCGSAFGDSTLTRTDFDQATSAAPDECQWNLVPASGGRYFKIQNLRLNQKLVAGISRENGWFVHLVTDGAQVKKNTDLWAIHC